MWVMTRRKTPRGLEPPSQRELEVNPRLVDARAVDAVVDVAQILDRRPDIQVVGDLPPAANGVPVRSDRLGVVSS